MCFFSKRWFPGVSKKKSVLKHGLWGKVYMVLLNGNIMEQLYTFLENPNKFEIPKR